MRQVLLQELGRFSRVGGLVGDGRGITNSYWDKWTSGRTASSGGEAKTTVELQEPTTATGIYSSWSTEAWDFGTTKQYPALKYLDGAVMLNQPRGRPDLSHRLSVEIVGVPTGAVDEGERITLTASSSSSTSIIPLNYRWSQISGRGLLIGSTTRSSVTIEVPEDYVPASTSSINATLVLEALSDIGITSQHVSITIAKRNNGPITVLGAPSLNERELAAPAMDLSGDPDGGGSNVGYQWQSRESGQTTGTAWTDVPTGMSGAYTIAEDVTGIVQYRVVVSYTDGQGYSEEVISQVVVYERRYSLAEIASLTSCGTTDVDQDDDGLIEICNLEGLDAMRYQLDGSGYRPSSSTIKITAGCPATGCKGYELIKDLDFDDVANYRNASINKRRWTTGEGWEPIPSFTTTFDGNGYTISKLMINSSQTESVGLFGYASWSSKIIDIGLLNINVIGASHNVGGLIGANFGGSIMDSYVIGSVLATNSSSTEVGGLIGTNFEGSITTSYAAGSVSGTGEEAAVGGLVGNNYGTITNSYAMGSVSGNEEYAAVGGLIGQNSFGIIMTSYATSSVTGTGRYVGGLVGNNWWDVGVVTTSYWDKLTSGQTASAGGEGKTTIELQEPTTTTGIYRSWSTDVWDFGTTEQYPALKYRDGTVMPNQPRERPDLSHRLSVEIAGVPAGAINEGERITLTAFYSSSASVIPLDYRWSQVSGGGLLIEPTSQSSVTIEVPEDYVSAGASTVNVAIMLGVISDVGSTTQQVVITIAKRNNGQIAALGAPSLNERELTAPSIDLSDDPDGGGINVGYQWQSRENTATAWEVNVPTGTSG